MNIHPILNMTNANAAVTSANMDRNNRGGIPHPLPRGGYSRCARYDGESEREESARSPGARHP